MTSAIIVAVCLIFVLLPWSVLMVLIVNRMIADYREWKRGGGEVDPIDRDFWRLCYVTLMISIWLKGW